VLLIVLVLYHAVFFVLFVLVLCLVPNVICVTIIDCHFGFNRPFSQSRVYNEYDCRLVALTGQEMIPFWNTWYQFRLLFFFGTVCVVRASVLVLFYPKVCIFIVFASAFGKKSISQLRPLK